MAACPPALTSLFQPGRRNAQQARRTEIGCSHAFCHVVCCRRRQSQPTLSSSAAPSAVALGSLQARAQEAAAGAEPEPIPYSQLSTPVYSLSTADAAGGSETLNLVTYAAPISLKPRHYALGLYEGTLSRENMLSTGRGMLQILGEQHADLFELLGKTSGRAVDKLTELRQRGLQLERRAGLPVLADCLGYMELRIVGERRTLGDHEVVICEVVSWETLSPGTRPLYTGYLREQGKL